MSGGSYGYLYSRHFEEVVTPWCRENLRELRDQLTAMGYLDAAQQTNSALAVIAEAEQRFEGIRASLSEVWRAVEWMNNGDYGESEIASAITGWRDSKHSSPADADHSEASIVQSAERAAEATLRVATLVAEIDRGLPDIMVHDWGRLRELVGLAKANSEMVAARLAGEAAQSIDCRATDREDGA